MNTLTQERENVENNAQEYFEFYINYLSEDSREIEMKTPLYGDLDLSVLGENFPKLEKISFSEKGEITYITGIPSTIKSFQCSNQFLVDLPVFPDGLEELVLNNNYLDHIDVRNLKSLKILNVNHNQITSVEVHPENIEELYLDYNEIAQLDLNGFHKLRVLHAIDNEMMTIRNVPASVVDLRVVDGNRGIDVHYAFEPKGEKSVSEKPYLDALKEYFFLKTKYETKAKAYRNKIVERGIARGLGIKIARKAARKAVPVCIKCKRNVGMIFKNEGQHYIGRCGDQEKPCGFFIDLFRGNTTNRNEMLETFRLETVDIKEEIIIQKMDTLFGYEDERKAVESFQAIMDKFRSTSTIYKEYLDNYNDMYYSPHRRELVKNKMQTLHDLKKSILEHIEEYEKTGHRDVLKVAVDIYAKQYVPEVANLRMLKYEIMESNYNAYDKTTELHQDVVSLAKRENAGIDPPAVVKFHV